MSKNKGFNAKSKKALKKALAVFLATSMTLSAGAFNVFADEDFLTRGEVCDMLLTAADDYNPGVQKSDILRGYANGELNEDNAVTRVEALIMLKRAFGEIPEITGNNKYLAYPKDNFTDVPQWAESELEQVLDSGIVSGKSDGTFAPNDKVSAEEMQTFIKRMYRVFGTNKKDDFYATVNKEDLDTAVIPEGSAAVGTLYNDIVDNELEDLISEVASSNPEKNSKQDKIKTLYNNYLNKDERNAQGYEPIREDLENIDAVKSVSDFTKTNVNGSLLSDVFFGFGLTIDPNDSNQYAHDFSTRSFNSKDMYEGEQDEQKNMYLEYIKKLFILTGNSEEEAEKAANDVFDFEKEIAGASLSVIETYDTGKTQNRYSFEELKKIFKTTDLDESFDFTGLKEKDEFIVEDVGAMNKTAELLTDENLEMLKNYAKFIIINCYALYLSDDFRDASLAYDLEMMGIEGSRGDEYYATMVVSSFLEDYVGELYADKYVTETMRTNLTEMINDIIDVYRERITNLDWMSDTTKKEALKKLDTMDLKVLAPTQWKETSLDSEELRSYADGGNLVENIRTINSAILKDYNAKEGQSVDKTAWTLSPQTENACYDPEYNDITVLAAFVEMPYVYDENASYEENLGGIGFVIGHEISHAFDSNGSQYDEKGNTVNWWTDEDAAKFEELCNKVVEFYDGQEGAPGIEFDPEQTLGENIADLGSISVITELASKKENFDYDKMYSNIARVWCMTATREYIQLSASEDVHSYASTRINRVFQTINKFYEVYDITEKDGMWVSPDERVSIW